MKIKPQIGLIKTQINWTVLSGISVNYQAHPEKVSLASLRPEAIQTVPPVCIFSWMLNSA